ncbi:tail fiber assembly protein [Shewanella sp. M-Br]|uniref:tail fiber assembly protein n=1 Tax=Shewanella sp. M-Br TaxID=2495595 RepID=UPI002949BEF3|nr:hypothetical protein SMBr_15110 [Shewanella sp. M-Br]
MENQTPIDVIKNGHWKENKMIRDRLLRETDFTQMPDSPLSIEKAEEFKIYRQALRDLPQMFDDPLAVVWPVKPE